MSGLTFHRTLKYKEVVSFYRDRLNMDVWLEQGGCTILQKGNFLIGFCDRSEADTDGMITFFFETREEIDELYSQFEDIAADKPKETPEYRIYHFFARDPEGRNVEFQTFLHRTEPHHEGREMLTRRRSIRHFTGEGVSKEVLRDLFESCRYVPTSCNTQAYFFKLIDDPSILKKLASVREGSSAPIGRAPQAVVAYTDSSKTKRPEQDGAIASTYLLLSAAQHGLGACWIGGMDRDDVKELVGLDKEKHIAMITPLGWPDERKALPERRTVDQFVEGL